MKDYSNHQTNYAIVDYRGAFAIAEVIERSREDASRVLVKTDRLSISKHVSTLQQQINEMIERESTPAVSGFEQWQEDRARRARYKAKRREKVEAK